MKKFLSVAMSIIMVYSFIFGYNFKSVATADDFQDIYTDELVFMDDATAQSFIGFIYNVPVNKVTDEMKSLDDIFNYLTGRLSKGTTEYQYAQISFLLTAESFINRHIEESNKIVTISSQNLISLLQAQIGEESDIAEDIVNDTLGEIKKRILKIFYYVGDFDSSDVINNLDLAMSGYQTIAGIPGKVEDIVTAIKAIVNTTFLLTSNNTKQAYTCYSTYLNNRHLGPEIVEVLMDYLGIGANFFDGLTIMFEKIGFGNSWTNDKVQRLIRIFAEFTYHSKVEFQNNSGSNDGSESTEESTIFTYTVNDGEVTITGLKNGYAPTTLIIPSTIGGKEVTQIGKKAFYENETIEKVVISSGVTTINNRAFCDCINLQRVSIPNTVNTIGEFAFALCDKLINFTIPNGVIEIGDDAFLGCDGLTTITIPHSVTTMSYNAFHSCASLTEFIVDEDNLNFSSIDGVLFNKSQTCLIQCPASKNLKEYVVPDMVTVIKGHAFNACKNLQEIIIGDSVRSIGSFAFQDCINLSKVVIGNNVRTIGSYAFGFCEALEDLSLGEELRVIQDDAFTGCIRLKDIMLPNKLTTIGDYAFYGCEELSNISIPDSVKKIGDGAFGCCDAFTNIIIPNSVTTFGVGMFFACENLTSVILPEGLTAIGERTFEYCYKLKDVTIPEGVTTIGNNAFYYCSSLMDIKIPNNVVSIGERAFANCDSLIGVKIPNSVTEIYDYAFAWNANLKRIFIPNSVVAIGQKIFYEVDGITIYGFFDSTIESYANSNKHSFLAMSDLDFDGELTSKDYTIISSATSIEVVLTEEQNIVGDINQDGAVDGFDAIYLDLILNEMI